MLDTISRTNRPRDRKRSRVHPVQLKGNKEALEESSVAAATHSSIMGTRACCPHPSCSKPSAPGYITSDITSEPDFDTRTASCTPGQLCAPSSLGRQFIDHFYAATHQATACVCARDTRLTSAGACIQLFVVAGVDGGAAATILVSNLVQSVWRAQHAGSPQAAPPRA